MRTEMQALADLFALLPRKIGRTFGDNHYLRPFLSVQTLAQPARRQHAIKANQSMIIGEQHVYSGRHLAILVSIVQQDHVGSRCPVLQGFTNSDFTAPADF